MVIVGGVARVDLASLVSVLDDAPPDRSSLDDVGMVNVAIDESFAESDFADSFFADSFDFVALVLPFRPADSPLGADFRCSFARSSLDSPRPLSERDFVAVDWDCATAIFSALDP